MREYDIKGSPNKIAFATDRIPPTLYEVAGNNIDHFHASDRARANHTGTQVMATISDLPVLSSGIWTPTLTNVTNLATSTAFEGQFLRLGNTVTCSGKVDIDPTATGAVELGISLPIASNFGTEQDCAGVAAGLTTATIAAAILADTVNDRASLQYVAVDTTNKSFYFNFSYQLL